MSARLIPAKFALHLLLPVLANRAKASVGSSNTKNQGLTLIECLIAIIVIAVTVVAITPPVFLATATRIQSRRAEQANQIAQAEIDRIRTIVERGTYSVQQVPATTGGNTPINTFGAAASVDTGLLLSSASCPGTTKYPQPPTTPPATPITPVANNILIPVDVDGDCKAEYAMQVFRTQGCIPGELASLPNPPAPYSFYVGVRVYAYNGEATLPTLATERATLAMTTGRRDQTQDSRKPLQTLYTKMVRSNTSNSLECAAQ